MTSKPCPDHQIFNTQTKRCVNRDGRIGRKIVREAMDAVKSIPVTKVKRTTTTTPVTAAISEKDIAKVESLLRKLDSTVDPLEKNEIQRQIQVFKEKYDVEFPSLSGTAYKSHLLRQKEFQLSKYTPDYVMKGTSPDFFTLTPSQIFLKKLMSGETEHNGILLFHGVGVGKSCTSIQIAENFKDIFGKRAIVLLPTSALKDNYTKALFDSRHWNKKRDYMKQCTTDEYLHQIPDRDFLTKKQLDKRAKKLIKSKYQMMGYGEFVNFVVGDKLKKNPQRVAEYFSNRVIIVDEVHNMRLSSDSAAKKSPEILKYVLRHAHNVKLVLLSATPMFNRATEVSWIMELLMLNDKRQFDVAKFRKHFYSSDGSIKPETKRQLAEFAAEYVSFMRGDNPVTFPLRLLPSHSSSKAVIDPKAYPSLDVYKQPIPKHEQIRHLELVGCEMSPVQKSVYDKLGGIEPPLQPSDTVEMEDEAEERLGNDMQSKVQVSNICYPNPNPVDTDPKRSIGEQGFLGCFGVNRDKQYLQAKYKTSTLKSHGEILGSTLLKQYSPKFNMIIDHILKSEGIVFVYSRYLYSGVVPLAIALEHAGFAKSDGQPMVTGIKDTQKRRGTYAILSGSVTAAQRDKDIQLARSYDNRNGEKLKVLLVTDVASEGIDFKNIREVHIVEPWFNMNRIEQIIGRGVRFQSHHDLPEEKRNCTIYQYVNMLPSSTSNPSKEESIDFRMYRISENKQKTISQVERVLKENAIDCPLNEEVLVFGKNHPFVKTQTIITSQGVKLKDFVVSDQEYSKQCDYTQCNLKCARVKHDPPGQASKPSALRPSLVAYEIKLYIQWIQLAFKEVVVLSVPDLEASLRDHITEYEPEVLQYALQEMAHYKREFAGKDGRLGYILLRGSAIVFQPSDIMDTKIGVHERLHKKKQQVRSLPFTLVGQKRAPESAMTIPAQTISDTKAKELASTLAKEISLLEAKHDTMSKEFVRVLSDVHSDLVWDMVVDRMNADAVQTVCGLLQSKMTHAIPLTSGEEVVLRALERSLMVSLSSEKSATIEFLFLPEVNDFVCYDGMGWTSCSPLQKRHYKQQLNAYVKHYLNKKEVSLHGYVSSASKKQTENFKLIEPKLIGQGRHSGSICVQTSGFSVAKMKEWIAAVLPKEHTESVKSDTLKITKAGLCRLYEYALRLTTGDKHIKFLRPVAMLVFTQWNDDAKN
jgi:superfamily II DNA or RNA helicase